MHPPVEFDVPLDALNRAARCIRAADRLVVLTGAGVSAESGLSTFRGPDGLWEGQRPEDVATPEAFARDPAMVWRFYNARRAALARVEPNPGHRALVDLEQRFAERFTLITQNVDALHRVAGNRRLLEIHGNLTRVRCTGCGQITERGTEPLPDLPRCDTCRQLLRPDVVWFHEMLPQHIWRAAEEAVCYCACFLVVGTSAIVYPAAGLVQLAKDYDAHVIEINLNPTQASSLADVRLFGPSGTILPELIKRL
jgi:NAD-dependent deacetylase